MPNVTTGTKAIDFTYDSPYKTGIKLSDKVKEADKTFLMFSRYYGCTLCKLEMHELKEMYDQFTAKGAQVLYVLQSPPSTITEFHAEGDLPFEIVCDPEMKLYVDYELPAAASKEEMLPPEAMELMAPKREKMKQLRLAHGAYEGEELQLPGVFLLDKDMNVLFDKRCKTLLDKPTLDEILAML